MHCDISAWSILLAVIDSPESGGEGFLIDLEFALYSWPKDAIRQWTNSPRLRPSGVNPNSAQAMHIRFDGGSIGRGGVTMVNQLRVRSYVAAEAHDAVLQGTRQFMARDLLEYMVGPSASEERQPPLRAAKHDIESFLWVFSYTISWSPTKTCLDPGRWPTTTTGASSVVPV